MAQRNSEKYPKAWAFFEEQARNITAEQDLVHLGNYRIPCPDASGKFIYAKNVVELWSRFINFWTVNVGEDPAEQVYHKIQYIVNHF